MKLIKFNDLPSTVPNLENIKEKMEKLSEQLENAESPKDALKAVEAAFRLHDKIESQLTIISVRYSINTLDTEIKDKNQECDEVSPYLGEIFNSFFNQMLVNKHRDFLEKKLGTHLFNIIENEKSCFEPVILEDLVEENRLTNEYDSFIASAEIPFDNAIYNLTQISKFMSSTDRDVRIRAAHAYWGFFEKNDDIIGDMYTRLVNCRNRMAHKLGYKNFVELGYKRLDRLDYNADMVKGYREQIRKVVVPEVQKLVARQMKRIGVKNPVFVDYNLQFKNGNATPRGTSEDLINAAREMYHEMSDETGYFFDVMADYGYMDLDAKLGKMSGGYMTYIPTVRAPFIFSNSNGTSADVDTLTHEFGHAFQGYLGGVYKVPHYRAPTLEACEIHSMSMEFFAYPWMDLFFGRDANKYRYAHLSSAIEFLPYGVAVDEFQHFVYENPTATHAERCAKWKEIDQKYRPWMTYEGFDYLNKGTFWMKQAHIFDSPFYYIDYTLAQVLALQFKCEMDRNRDRAWNKYIKLLKLAGKYPFITLIEKAGLRNPFVDGNVEKVIKPQIKQLNKMNRELTPKKSK